MLVEITGASWSIFLKLEPNMATDIEKVGVWEKNNLKKGARK